MKAYRRVEHKSGREEVWLTQRYLVDHDEKWMLFLTIGAYIIELLSSSKPSIVIKEENVGADDPFNQFEKVTTLLLSNFYRCHNNYWRREGSC